MRAVDIDIRIFSGKTEKSEEQMEVIGALILILVVCLNASSFFMAGKHQRQIYDRTASDTEFNKAHT